MRKLFLLTIAACMAVAASAQELPYSKYLNFDKKDFRENHFKYNDKTNTWSVSKINGWMTAFNVLAVVADGIEDVRPARNDYSILVQLGKDDKVAFIKVWFYNSQTYHKLLKFVKENGQNIIETSSGKLRKHTATYGNYSIVLGMEQHIISRTSARTIDPMAVKTVDESYNEYEFTIDTGVEPWSKKIEKRAAKSAKRDAKGKKKRSVEEMM